MELNRTRSPKNLCVSVFIGGFIFLFSLGAFLYFNDFKAVAEDRKTAIENALFTRQEFFGAAAIVPLPTEDARANLAKLNEIFPDDAEILSKLSELHERLEKYDAAEANLNRLAEIDSAKLETLAAFYRRRGAFAKEAATLQKILFAADAGRRGAIFERLIETARRHDLQAYLSPVFYAQVAEANPTSGEIFQRLIERLREEKNFVEALKFTRQAKAQFPDRRAVWLAAEVEMLLEIDRSKEAEAIYQAAFDPFWSDAEAEDFYDFLSNQDRLRAYGAELKARLKKNPADFDAAIRLALYRKNDYESGNDAIAPVILKLEAAKKDWTADELVTITRLLLRENAAELAARFLYTLYLQRADFRANGALRATILYQLFQMFAAAENRKLPITTGDLRFYEDVARADQNPGMATGILSLIFSDTEPGVRLAWQENAAGVLFNRAAAFRIFEEYKKESANTPELARMYLDLVRLYTATDETEIAAKTLDEFAEKFGGAAVYPSAALKLAEAFAAAAQPEKERAVYRKILDRIGKTDQPKRAPIKFDAADSSNDAPAVSIGSSDGRGDGTGNPGSVYENPPVQNYSDSESDLPANNFQDYLGEKNLQPTYETVLEKYVASYAEEKKTAEILALYSDEIQKYPHEEWLYEKRLAALEQTNLTEEQLAVYKAALARFATRGWQDRLARWFVRRQRARDFAELSEDLIGKLDDAETRDYLAQFVDGKASASGEFERELYLKLYRRAHERFPHNTTFVKGLLNFYRAHEMRDEWRKLAARFYFESKEIREMFLDDLAAKGELRTHLAQARDREGAIYELFRADGNARLSNYENAVAAYRKLNEIYPHAPEFSERLVAFARSFGQKNRELLNEAAIVAKAQADYEPANAARRTASGEIFAELGDYEKANAEWGKLISTARGDREVYRDAATVYWDYYQYTDALRTIGTLRAKESNQTLYAFEAGAIFEARHEKSRAVQEYIKALAARDAVDEWDDEKTAKEKALNRLAFLAGGGAAENEMLPVIATAFARENDNGKNAPYLALGYAEFLAKIKKTEKAVTTLNPCVAASRDEEFLTAARDFYASEEIAAGEQFTLQRLAVVTENRRRKIGYRLQLIESFSENKQREFAESALRELAGEFPANYGVLTEAADFYWRLGYEAEAVALLQNALPRSRGEYKNALARKLAGRLVQSDQMHSAEQILVNLHAAEPANAEIFRELGNVLVRTGKPDRMRAAFFETVAALKASDSRDRRELDAQIAELRRSMIDAFTRLKDYQSAIEQHVEIVNREPEKAELLEDAIRYAKRYGAANILLDYYLKLSEEAFKNYRWNVVLARIYAASDDAENAAANYRAAIVNQPEMPELYAALADLEIKRGDFDAALKNLDRILELTNNDAQHLKKKIEVLKRAGRLAEAETEQAKLPAEKRLEETIDEFAEARKLAATEKEKSRELYRAAFGKLLENPLSGEMRAADIAGYATAAREQEPLGAVNERLWTLREKLSAIADAENSTDAGAARSRISILEGVMTETVGGIAKTFGTDDELAALHADWRQRLDDAPRAERHRVASFVQDLSRRAGFGNLEETILLEKIEASAPDDRRINLRNLVHFYNERGAYQKAFDALHSFGGGDLQLELEAARLVGNREKEIEALRLIYRQPGKISTAPSADVARYLEILHAENRAELQALTAAPSVFQIQLINFLLGRGEREMAHAAIENAGLTAAWKAARHAEVSLALREFDETAECFFCQALRFDSIGNLIRQTPDKKSFLVGDEWFRLTREYGEWLEEKARANGAANESAESVKYLAAMIENQPRSADEQFKRGEFHLARNAPQSAIEPLRLALEIENSAVADPSKLAHLGAAYQMAGDERRAAECFAEVLEDADLETGAIYFETLRKYNLAAKARGDLSPLLVNFLKNNNADQSEDFQSLIRDIAASFGDEKEKAAYFMKILEQRKTDKSLAAMLVDENLLAKNQQTAFYELLIERGDGLNDYDRDYNFAAITERVWADGDAEAVYERENRYKTTEPGNERVAHQKKYLALLVELRADERAARLVAEIEKDLRGRYARPAWLRLAALTLQIRAGAFDARAAENFVGIADGAAAETILPNVERFNDVLRILKEENRLTEAAQFSESFFAQNLALGQFDNANFAGLAGVYFQAGETEKAMQILRLFVDANDAAKRDAALAEVGAFAPVAAKRAGFEFDIAPVAAGGSDLPAVLRLAAEIAQRFGQTDAAISLRRRLSETNPAAADNRLELAELLILKEEKSEAANLLTQIVSDRNAPRAARWQARMLLFETGANVEIADAKFDALAQFYTGIFAARNQSAAAIEFFVDALVADRDAEVPARQELIKAYAAAGNFFAALKVAETDRTAKSDALLETLVGAAERIGDFDSAIRYEQSKTAASAERIAQLQQRASEKNHRATDFTVDLENTRNL